MADKRDHNATMNSKGLDDSVSDDDARRMIHSQGATSILIVEVQHGKYATDVDGSQRINLIPGSVALVPQAHEDKLRRLLRAVALETNPGETFALDGDGAAPRVEEAVSDLPDEADKTWTGDPADKGPERPAGTAKKATAKKATAKKATAKKAAAKGGPQLASVPDAD